MINKQRLPLGIKVLVAFICLSIIGVLGNLSFNKFAFFLSKVYIGQTAFIINLSYLIILVIFLYGFIKLQYRVWVVSLIFYAVNLLTNIYLLTKYNIGILPPLLNTINSLAQIIFNGLIIWYLYNKRALFKGKIDSRSKIDTPFVITYFVLLVALFVLNFVFAINSGLPPQEIMEKMIYKEIWSNPSNAMRWCNTKSGTLKEACIVGIMKTSLVDKKYSNGELCSEIEEERLKNLCYLAFAQANKNPALCNKINHPSLRISACALFIIEPFRHLTNEEIVELNSYFRAKPIQQLTEECLSLYSDTERDICIMDLAFNRPDFNTCNYFLKYIGTKKGNVPFASCVQGVYEPYFLENRCEELDGVHKDNCKDVANRPINPLLKNSK